MPPVRVIFKEEVTATMGVMGYSHTADHQGRSYYSNPKLQASPVILDFGDEGSIPWFVLVAMLNMQGIDTHRFGPAVS